MAIPVGGAIQVIVAGALPGPDPADEPSGGCTAPGLRRRRTSDGRSGQNRVHAGAHGDGAPGPCEGPPGLLPCPAIRGRARPRPGASSRSCLSCDVLVVLPTYNEAENIDRVLRRIRQCLRSAAILVVDDGSPDGTADIAEVVAQGAAAASRSSGVTRSPARERLPGRVPVGRSSRGFDACVEMDADLSHEPEALARAGGAARRPGTTSSSGPATSRAGRSPTGPGTAGCSSRGATSTPPVMLGPRRGRLDRRVPGLRGLRSRRVDLDRHPSRGLRVPDRDDLSGQAARRRRSSRCRSASSTGSTASRRCPRSSSSRPP